MNFGLLVAIGGVFNILWTAKLTITGKKLTDLTVMDAINILITPLAIYNVMKYLHEVLKIFT